MQNLKAIALAAALCGGLVMFVLVAFVLGTSHSPPVVQQRAEKAPARLPTFEARPLQRRRRLELSSMPEAATSDVQLANFEETKPTTSKPAPSVKKSTTKTKSASSEAPTPEITGLFTDAELKKPIPDANGGVRTATSKLFVQVPFDEAKGFLPPGRMVVVFGKGGPGRERTVAIKEKSDLQILAVDVSGIEMKQAEEVRLRWDPDGNGEKQLPSALSESKPVWIDNVPPRILSVRPVGETGGVVVLEIQLANGDLKPETITPANFLIHRTAGQHEFATAHANFTILDRSDDSLVVRLNLGSLVTDLYQVEVKAAVTDQHGNALTGPRKFEFHSLPEKTSGTHVAFPEFVPRKARSQKDVFNPGDKVETRVARLYYIRDAHRVAQIVNRNTKSHNQAGVDRAKLTAISARETAEQAARDRKAKMDEAIRAATSNRQLERELAGARQKLEGLRAQYAQQAQAIAQAKEKKEEAPTFEPSHESVLQDIRDTAALVAELERSAADKRQAENDLRDQAERAQELEDRARENQFRAEVAASTEDPDTYVPGDVQSVDPVTQVSVSVIGEGVLQLRGPIRGINKIRTMINQIDSPLGQVKVGIFTVQINGEHGDRMEKVASRVEGHIDLSRFLTNQSLGYLRRAIQEVAGAVVANADAQHPNLHRQLDRDRKYLYAFFGRDFIDELYEMDSEFLRTENKLLSLHGMDTISQSQACFLMALAKNDIRQQILDRFRCLVECELPQAEWDYRKTSSLLPCKLNSQKEVFRNACEKYKFRNVHGFFEASVYDSDTMTPMQREFIRLAQIFKSQMVAEVELMQRVIERGMIEDQSNDESRRADLLEDVREEALQRVKREFQSLIRSQDTMQKYFNQISAVLDVELPTVLNRASGEAAQVAWRTDRLKSLGALDDRDASQTLKELTGAIGQFDSVARQSQYLSSATKSAFRNAQRDLNAKLNANKNNSKGFEAFTQTLATAAAQGQQAIRRDIDHWEEIRQVVRAFQNDAEDPATKLSVLEERLASVRKAVTSFEPDPEAQPKVLREMLSAATEVVERVREREVKIARAEYFAKRVRRDLDHRKLLEHLIDEQEEKYIELVEGTRSHIAQIDNYLKRLAIALEDDFKVQFYDPAFAGVRAASREWDVNLGQVERTTILTNNRQFAKVEPQATMEFDLPKRAPMIVEGMNGARALVQEYGSLLQDPTFLSLSGMMSGSPVSAATGGAGTPVSGLPNQGLRTPSVRNVLPGQSTDTAEQLMAQSGGPDRKFGAALEGLIPDPAIYKFDTGTGFEIRPVIQPDGHSVIYDFDYMYTTNVREPVRPDEKHLGRVKRHFIHTQVQTSSFELREISRYQVALKASRTSRGVPLLEDIPGAGVLFRPLPSDESSLQQNIILGQSTVYPTLFDLMGLRWSKYVVDLDHINLRDLEHVTRGREQAIRDFTFDEASDRVDQFLDIKGKHSEHLRPDLYHQQRQTSPYHPGGHHYVPEPPMQDLRNRSFTIPDRRPEEYREPPYDTLRRNPVDSELQQIPNPGGQPENLRLIPPEVPPQESSSRPRPQEAGPAVSAKASPPTPKFESPIVTVQSAAYQQKVPAPKVIDDQASRANATSPAVARTPPTTPKKKSWVGNLKPSFSK